MARYVSRADVVINGQAMTDMKDFDIKALKTRDQVNMMNKTGYVNKTVRHQFSLDYVKPAGTPFDFAGLEGATVVVSMDDGSTINYSNVCTLELGDLKMDGEKEAVQTILFGAESRADQ